jgi:hypothetical protein
MSHDELPVTIFLSVPDCEGNGRAEHSGGLDTESGAPYPDTSILSTSHDLTVRQAND